MSASPTSFLSASLLVLVGLAGACGRNALYRGSSANPQDGAPATGASNISQPPTDGKCPDGFAPCGKGDALRCYDLGRSKDHCGACGQACAPGIACQAGICQQYRCRGALGFEALAVTSTEYGDPSGSRWYAKYLPALGDLDGDGILDLVGVPDLSSDNGPMSLFYGAGDGTFPTRRAITSAQEAWQSLAADLDGDGFLDLTTIVLAHTSRGTSPANQPTVTVRRGSGERDAPFGEAADYSTSSVPSAVLVADFNADGRLDLVARVQGELAYWLGRDGGRLEPQAPLETEESGDSYPPEVNPLATDWNGDGVLDLVYGSLLHFRLGRGDGSFDSEVPCALAMGVVGDLDSDRRPDLITGANLLLGIDACHASKILPLPDWPTGGGMALADLDGDGNLDVVADSDTVTDNHVYIGTNVTVRAGDGKGGFGTPISLPGPGNGGTSSFLFGDLNRDGKLDFIFARPDGWGVFLNTCR